MDNTLVVIIPQLDFWGVFHEDSRVPGKRLLKDSYHTLFDIIQVVQQLELTPVHVQHIGFLPQSIYARHHDVIELDGESDFKVIGKYIDAFLNPVTKQALRVNYVEFTNGTKALAFPDGDADPFVLQAGELDGEFYRGDNAYSTDKIVIADSYLRVGGHLYISEELHDELKGNLESTVQDLERRKQRDIHAAAAAAEEPTQPQEDRVPDIQAFYEGQPWDEQPKSAWRGGPGFGAGLATGALAGGLLGAGYGYGYYPGIQYYPSPLWANMLYAPGYGYYFPRGYRGMGRPLAYRGGYRGGFAHGGRRMGGGGGGRGGGGRGGGGHR